ncbi:6408_t:CDS:2, partial [Acaulospora colombiana]
NDWFNVNDAATGKLRMSCIWKPIPIEDSLDTGVGAYVDPIGVIRVHTKKAVGLKSSGPLGGKCDPYVVLKLNNIFRGRTEMILDTCNPEWNDEIFYIPVHSIREIINLTVWDYENAGKDKLVGSTEFKVGQLFKQNEDGMYSPTETLDTSFTLSHNGENRGHLFFTASYHPTVQTPKVIAEKEGDVEIPEVISEEGKGDAVEVSNVVEEKKVAEVPNVTINEPECQSGILIVNLKKATLEKRGALVDVIVDNALFPSFTSNSSKTQNPEWNQESIGEPGALRLTIIEAKDLIAADSG